MRETLERIFLKAVRLYTFHTPVAKGKYRLQEKAFNLCQAAPQEIIAETPDGLSR